MTQEDIIKMARRAGGMDRVWPFQRSTIDHDSMILPYVALERFAALVAAAEREACAKLVESEWSNVAERVYGNECAAAIRARGESK